MEDVFGALPAEERKAAVKTLFPAWVEPMLAVLSHEPFSREGWIFEPKLDGERCLAFKDEKALKLLSRNRKILNGGYPELVAELEKEEHSFVIDGEVVALEQGRSSFKKLQGRIGLHDIRASKKQIPVYYYIFDILYLDGFDTRKLKLRWRKQLLSEALEFGGPLRFTPHIQTNGEAMFLKACRNGEEGIMAKDFDGQYTSTRSSSWLKFKCSNTQELVIGGYTPGAGRREGLIGAILVGYYQGDKLRYAGKVGTGFSDQVLLELTRELESLKQGDSPFSDDVKMRRVTWVRPILVAQITFGEWTQYDHLRIPRYQGLRRDKPASQVVRES